jgi:hypothetical protein
MAVNNGWSVSVTVSDEAHGEPRMLDRGFQWWYPMDELCEMGAFPVDADGVPLLQRIDGIGLVMSPFVYMSDNLLSDWTVNSGYLEEWYSDSGEYVSRLSQPDADGPYTTAISNYTVKENPTFCLTLQASKPPVDYDYGVAPYFVFTFGTGAFAILFAHGTASLLEEDGAGGMQTAMDLGSVSYQGGYGKVDEMRMIIRCLNGRISISTDEGRNYKNYPKNKSIYRAEVPAGKFEITSEGTSFLFGVHEVDFVNSDWQSPQRNTGVSRPAATASFASISHEPSGTSVTYSDTSVGVDRIASFSAIFTKSDVAGTPFVFHDSPVLEATYFYYPFISSLLGSGTSTPWDSFLYYASVDKPKELSGGTCTLKFRVPVSDWDQNLRLRKIAVDIKEIVDGVTTTTRVFTGYVSAITRELHLGYTEVVLTAISAAGLWNALKWTLFDVRSLDVLTANAAADWVLSSEGWDASRRSWHFFGNQLIEQGRPERPTIMTKPGSPKFGSLQEMFDPLQLECGADDLGVLFTVPRFYTTGVVHQVTARAWAVKKERPRSVTVTTDYLDSATAVAVTGKDIGDQEVAAWVVDWPAENSILSGRYSPFRIYHQEDMPGTTDRARVTGKANSLSQELLALKDDATFPFWVNPAVGRKDELEVSGMESEGLPDGVRLVVETVKHEVAISPETGVWQHGTIAGARRLR